MPTWGHFLCGEWFRKPAAVQGRVGVDRVVGGGAASGVRGRRLEGPHPRPPPPPGHPSETPGVPLGQSRAQPRPLPSLATVAPGSLGTGTRTSAAFLKRHSHAGTTLDTILTGPPGDPASEGARPGEKKISVSPQVSRLCDCTEPQSLRPAPACWPPSPRLSRGRSRAWTRRSGAGPGA